MRSILKLMRANIRHGKGSFWGIVILMMLMTFSFSGTVSNNDRLTEARREKFRDSQIADLMMYMYSDNLSDEMLQEVRDNPAVSQVREQDAVFFLASVQTDGKDLDLMMSLTGAGDKLDNVFSEDGRSFKKNVSIADGEIYLPYKLHLSNDLQVGTELVLKTHSGYDEKYTVKGYYEDIVTGANTMGMNYCLVSDNDLRRIQSEKTDRLNGDPCCAVAVKWLHIYAAEGISQTELKKRLSDETSLISSANGAMTRDSLTDSIEMYSRVGTRTVAIFVVLLMIVTLITMYNSISATVELDYAQLGVLKAQGFTAWQIRCVYVLQYVIALILGGAAGILVSIPACYFLIGAWKNITGLMTDTGVSFAKCGVLCVVIVFVCTVFILIAAEKVRRISPVRAIAGGAGEVHFNSRLDLRIRQKPLSLFLALRQLNSRRKSYIGTVLIVMMLVYFIVSIMMLAGGLDTDKLFYQIGGDITLTNMGGLTLDSVPDVEEEIRKIDPGAVLETATYHRMLVDGELTPVHYFRAEEAVYKPYKGRAPIYENEIMITKNVSEQSGKKIGDSIRVKYMDKENDYVITGYFQTVWDFGYVTSVTQEGMRLTGYNGIEEAFVRLNDVSKREQVIDMLNGKYEGSLKAARFETDAFGDSYKKVVDTLMYSLTAAMYAVLLIFAAVIVNMVCKRTFIRERTDIGIFKAIGFTAGDLRRQFAVRFAVVAAAGAALGCGAGMLWSRMMISYVLNIVGLTDFTYDYPLSVFVLPALCVCLCFYVTAYISTAKVKSVEVRELVTE